MSPLRAPMAPEDYPPPAVRLPLVDDASYCYGLFCKLPGRIIPEGVQKYDVELQNGTHLTICKWCTTALHETPDHPALFGNNTMYANGFHP